MEKGKLEFKITEDSNGKSIELDNLSIHSAKALSIFLDSIIKIVDSMPDKDGIRIKVVKGSAGVIAEGPEATMAITASDFNDVVERSSSKKTVVDPWKAVQSLILQNGLQYEVNYYSKNDKKQPLIDQIKVKRVFRVKPKRKKSDTNLVFIKARLMQNGGSNPNFHLYINGEQKVIHCDEKTALRVNTFLYKDVMISAWCKEAKGSRPHYTFCDIYINDADFTEFKEFIESSNKLTASEEFISIHDKFNSYVEKKDFGKIKKLFRLYNSTSSDSGNLKALLVITKSFKNHPEIKEVRTEIKDLLEKKLGKKII
jgi:hypothetical protein